MAGPGANPERALLAVIGHPQHAAHSLIGNAFRLAVVLPLAMFKTRHTVTIGRQPYALLAILRRLNPKTPNSVGVIPQCTDHLPWPGQWNAHRATIGTHPNRGLALAGCVRTDAANARSLLGLRTGRAFSTPHLLVAHHRQTTAGASPNLGMCRIRLDLREIIHEIARQAAIGGAPAGPHICLKAGNTATQHRHPECLLAILARLQQQAANFIGAWPCAGNPYPGTGLPSDTTQ